MADTHTHTQSFAFSALPPIHTHLMETACAAVLWFIGVGRLTFIDLAGLRNGRMTHRRSCARANGNGIFGPNTFHPPIRLAHTQKR
mmetsp:Transcript_6933/g.16828  ORF Transcript_6933/g.16828 Transcript_6933/m.16828 type:complete len:86 (-) Transcript_6933:305-562(-)